MRRPLVAPGELCKDRPVRKSLATGLVLVGLLALPATAGAVLSGTNGRIVYINGPAFGNTQLFLRSVTSSTGAGTTTGPLATGLAKQHRHPTWSPDRTKIAFAEGPGGATGYDIYILDLTTPGATPRTSRIPRRHRRPPGLVARRHPHRLRERQRHHRPAADRRRHLNLTGTLTPKAWKAAWSPDSQTVYYSVGDITRRRTATTTTSGSTSSRRTTRARGRSCSTSAAPMCSSRRSHPTGRSSATRSALPPGTAPAPSSSPRLSAPPPRSP